MLNLMARFREIVHFFFLNSFCGNGKNSVAKSPRVLASAVIADFGEKNRSKIALSKFDFSNNKLEKIIDKKVLVEKP